MRSTHPNNFDAVTRLLATEITRKKEFQEMTELLSFICHTPIAMISLTGRDKQYIKFKVGIDLQELLKEDTFCQYISEAQQMLIIQDATKDQRFFDNPLVVKAPFVRFYAGMPLITKSGVRVGSICVLGRMPKELSATQKHRMRVLCKRISEMIELEFSQVA